MKRFRVVYATALSFLLSATAPATAQYIYLDANGDRENTVEDRLDPAGVTNLDVWLVTDRNRDGSAVTCAEDPTVSFETWDYTIVLRAVGGTVEWGPMQNRLPFDYTHTVVNFAASASDTTGDTEYHNGWGSYDIFPAGRLLLATLPVRVRSGNPSIVFAPNLSWRVTAITAFGTYCPGPDMDWTKKYGIDFHDADGIGGPAAEAGGPYHGFAGEPILFSGALSGDPHGAPLSYRWEFGDGGTSAEASPAHTYAELGAYPVTLTVSNGVETNADSTTATVVDRAAVAPVAKAGGPYSGVAGRAVQFDGGASFDPNGDPLTFTWRFGDGSVGDGMVVLHPYAHDGQYPVTLSVSDGVYAAQAYTSASIAPPPPRVLVPAAGGPYDGYAGRTLTFDGSRSTDSEGIAVFRWDFGDGVSGFGMYGHHAYTQAGNYSVRLTLVDAPDSVWATTVALISAYPPSRAFTLGEYGVFVRGGTSPTLSVQLEPVGNAFRALEVDPSWATLRYTSGGATSEITASTALGSLGDDTNKNGVPEATLAFTRQDLERLFAGVTATASVPVEVVAPLTGGGFTAASLTLTVRVPEAPFVTGVSPNPFNPDGTIRFETAVAGALRAEVFDLQGRRVLVLMDEGAAPAGRYTLRVGARHGLASGIYFYRITGADRTVCGRFAVAK